MQYKVIGDVMQALTLELQRGEQVYAEAGAMLYMTDGIRLDSKMQGGFLKGLARKFLAGDSLFMSVFECDSDQATVALANPSLGKIIAIELKGQTLLSERSSFLCSVGNVDLSVAFTKRLGAGFFGGEGFILQKLTGQGLVFLHAGGNIIEFNLKANEQLRVDTGCIVSFDESVHYDIQFVGGIKNALFGGEGMFFATLRGPGHVVLQTLPFSRLADRLRSSLSHGMGESKGVGGFGGILKDVISGD